MTTHAGPNREEIDPWEGDTDSDTVSDSDTDTDSVAVSDSDADSDTATGDMPFAGGSLNIELFGGSTPTV